MKRMSFLSYAKQKLMSRVSVLPCLPQKGKNVLTVALTAAVLGFVLSGYADPEDNPVSIETSNKYTPSPQNGGGTWVLGSVQVGYVEPAYSPIFIETFDNYVPGLLAGQGTWARNSSVWGGGASPLVSAGRDKHLKGDTTAQSGTAANCFFPNIFANGNNAGRIEFDFRRGVLELDFLVGPATVVNGSASNVLDQSIGGQFSCYNDGCFTPKYHGGYQNPLIIYRPWQPGTTYHLVMDLVKTGNMVTVTTTIDGVPLANLSEISFANTAPQGINSLMIRGSDYVTPECGIDNIKVSVPFKTKGLSLPQR